MNHDGLDKSYSGQHLFLLFIVMQLCDCIRSALSLLSSTLQIWQHERLLVGFSHSNTDYLNGGFLHPAYRRSRMCFITSEKINSCRSTPDDSMMENDRHEKEEQRGKDQFVG